MRCGDGSWLLAKLQLNVRQIADPIQHSHEALGAWHFKILVLRQRRIGFPRPDADGFAVALRLVDVVNDDADVMEFLEDRIHDYFSCEGMT